MWKKLTHKIKHLGVKPVLLGVGVLGLVLLLFGSLGDGCNKKESTTESVTSHEQYRETLTREAEALCRRVKGAGEVYIVLTLETGEEHTYAGSHLSSTTPPLVGGVAVVASGAGSDAVRAELTELLCALFHIGANRVHISPGTG